MGEVSYTSRAMKALKRLPAKDAQALVIKINAYVADPKSSHDFARAMTGSQAVRIRHGNWRAIGEWNGKNFSLFTIFAIGHRREIYR